MKCDTLSELTEFLKIQEQALGPKCSEVASTIQKIADLYMKESKYDEAEAHYQRALSIRETLSGLHKDEIRESEECLRKLRELKEPKRPQRISLDESLSDLKVSHSDVKAIREPICNDGGAAESVFWSAGSKSARDAIAEAETDLKVLREMVGDDNLSVANALTKLADLYCRSRLYGKMEPLLVEALKIRERHVGKDHMSVSTELKNLGRLYYFEGRYSLAEPCFKRAMTIREKLVGKMHPRVADIAEWYAKVLRKTNRITIAEELEDRVAKIKEKDPSNSLFRIFGRNSSLLR